MDRILVKFFVGDGFLLRQLRCAQQERPRGVPPEERGSSRRILSFHQILPAAFRVDCVLTSVQKSKYATSANAVHERHERREHHVVRDTRDAAFADAAFAASGLLLYKLVDFHAGHHGRSRASRLPRPLSRHEPRQHQPAGGRCWRPVMRTDCARSRNESPKQGGGTWRGVDLPIQGPWL